MCEHPKPFQIQIHLTDHCNLNCIGCNHFAPIAEKYCIDCKVLEKDCMRLFELSDGKIDEVILLGGEPLLHPDICNAIKIVSQIFRRNTQISIITNGILLTKIERSFWEICHQYQTKIIITPYPIKIPIHEIKSLGDKYCVKVDYGNISENIKTMECIPLDLSGTQDIEYNFKNCYKSNNCITLKDGRIYTCSLVPHVVHFCKFFNIPILPSESDSIDIYQADNIDEIRDFLSKPIPYCMYCNIKAIRRNIRWRNSQRDISEWT